MTFLPFTLFLFILVTTAAPASAAEGSGRVFPPDNCTAENSFLSFTGAAASNTFCQSAQDILRKALPSCQANQQVVFDGERFICQASEAPVGAVMAFNLNACPAGWTEFAPAYGRFVRGIDRSGTEDPDGLRPAGSLQEDMFKSHQHGNGVAPNATAGTTAWGWAGAGYNYQGLGDGGAFMRTNFEGGAETRPKNVALLFCEKIP